MLPGRNVRDGFTLVRVGDGQIVRNGLGQNGRNNKGNYVRGRWTETFGVGWGLYVRDGVGSRDGSGGICHRGSIIRQR